MENMHEAVHTQYKQKIFNPSIIGNIVSKEWKNLIVNKNNKPDRLGIDVYSYFVNWHLPKKIKNASNGNVKLVQKFNGDAFSTCYKYLSTEFNCSIEHLRRVIVKLEQLGLLKRDLRDVVIKGKLYKNRLFIILNKQAVYLGTSLKNADLKINLPSSKPLSSKLSCGGGSPHESWDNIDNTINIKTTNKLSLDSNLSEFWQNDFSEQATTSGSPSSDISATKVIIEDTYLEQELAEEQATSNNPAKKSAGYPSFTEDELEYIKIQSGRDYSYTAIKKIREKIDWKIEHLFYSKNHLINYCIKFVAKEIIPEFELNKLDYNFSRNDLLGKNIIAEERYLSKIEQCKDISLNSQLRRKIAGLFEAKIAYQLLTKCRFNISADNLCEVTLDNTLNLTELQNETLENAIKSVYGEIAIIYLESNNIGFVQENEAYQGKEGQGLEDLDPTSAWYKIRKELQRDFGNIIDKTWFSKLKTEEDHLNGKIVLKAPTGFIKSYIQQNYGLVIEKYCKMLNYQFDRFYSISLID